MKNPTHPPSKPLTAKRKKILEAAMDQLKKTRARMDPAVLGKIRSIIASNPKIMKGLGIDKMPEEAPVTQKTARKPSSSLQPVEQKVPEAKGEEKIDQAKNMEVIAKLMTLKPQEIKNIKEVLLKKKDF